MGWWGTDVLSGDQPLDDLAGIAHEMGLEFDDNGDSGLGSYLRSYHFTKELVEQHIDRLVASENVDRWDGQIRLQVLGVVAMAVGADIAESKIGKIIEAASIDEWAGEGDEGRLNSMRAFIEKLLAYSGNPVEDESRGLFS